MERSRARAYNIDFCIAIRTKGYIYIVDTAWPKDATVIDLIAYKLVLSFYPGINAGTQGTAGCF